MEKFQEDSKPQLNENNDRIQFEQKPELLPSTLSNNRNKKEEQ
jgi:hypothetical protein